MNSHVNSILINLPISRIIKGRNYLEIKRFQQELWQKIYK